MLFDNDYYFEIQGLGKLAEKFPNIASTSIYCLRDFLVTPSPILFKLHLQQCESTAKDGQKLKITGMLSFLLVFMLRTKLMKTMKE
jgi:phosphatidylinositol 4-kinase